MPKATKAKAKKQTILFENSGWVLVCLEESDIKSLGYLKKWQCYKVLPFFVKALFWC